MNVPTQLLLATLFMFTSYNPDFVPRAFSMASGVIIGGLIYDIFFGSK